MKLYTPPTDQNIEDGEDYPEQCKYCGISVEDIAPQGRIINPLYVTEKGDLLSYSVGEMQPFPARSVICQACRAQYEVYWITTASMKDLLLAVNYEWSWPDVKVLYKRVLAIGGIPV